MPLVNSILSYGQRRSAFEIELFTSELCSIHSKDTRWVRPMPSLICANPKDFTTHTYLVLHQVKLSTTDVIFKIREVNVRLCIEEVGVDLEPLCSCPWTRCRSHHKASLKLNYSLGISSSYIRDLCIDHLQSWSRPHFLLDSVPQTS